MSKYCIVGGFVFFLDMGTKWAAKFFLADNSILLWEKIFSLQLHFNTGIAFSLPVPRFFQIFLSLVFLVGFFFWAKKYFSDLNGAEKWGSVLLVSGAIGNLWERIIIGQVTDFISIWVFPIFNVADMAISIGVFLWILGVVFKKEKT